MKSKKSLKDIWHQVPIEYYQQGVDRSHLQKIWHGEKLRHCLILLSDLNWQNLLDVGCASGHFISQIQKQFPTKQYMGIDVYDKAVRHGKKLYPGIEFKVAPADKLPFKINSFDRVIFYETIEHVKNPERCLREINRILKPNGQLILAMDSGNWCFRIIWFFWERTYGRVWRGAHLHPFYHKDLEKLITDVGFKINKKLFTHLGLEVVFVLSK